jgi:aminopeptidase N
VVLPGGSETPQELDAGEIDLPAAAASAEWFKPNPGQTAFFRTLYTETMINALKEPLRTKKLQARDRFGVVNDVFAATEAGLTGSGTALRLVEALRNEPDYLVWGAVTSGFASLSAIVEDEPLREELDRFGLWLVGPNVRRLGWDAKDGESVFDTLMRPLVIQQAIRFDDGAVTDEAKRRFELYLKGEAVDPDLRPAVFYAAARHGGEREFDALLEHYRAEESPQVKMSLLAAMGRFHDPKMIDRFLEFGISPDVRPQDIYVVMAWGFRNRKGRDATWSFMKKNWELFLSRYGGGGHMIDRFPAYAADGFATHKMAGEIKEFFVSHPHPATKRPTAQAFEAVELKADWYARDKALIEAFLADHKNARALRPI